MERLLRRSAEDRSHDRADAKIGWRTAYARVHQRQQPTEQAILDRRARADCPTESTAGLSAAPTMLTIAF